MQGSSTSNIRLSRETGQLCQVRCARVRVRILLHLAARSMTHVPSTQALALASVGTSVVGAYPCDTNSTPSHHPTPLLLLPLLCVRHPSKESARVARCSWQKITRSHRDSYEDAAMHEPFWGKPSAISDSRETNYEHSPCEPCRCFIVF
jgi:hypothetical protein